MPRRPPETTTLLAAALLALACGRGAPGRDAPKAPAAAKAAPAAAPSLLEGASYEPPANGRLTESQVRMYLEVERRSQAGKAAANAAAELAAARELGMNPREYLWVAARVEEALVVRARESLDGQLAAGHDQYLAMVEAERAAAGPGSGEAAAPKGTKGATKPPPQAAAGEGEAPNAGAAAPDEPAELPPGVRENAELLAGFAGELAAVESPDEKFATGLLEADQPIPEELESGLGTDLEPPAAPEEP